MNKLYPQLLILLLLPLITGCETVQYYGQSIAGHLDLMAKRVPVEQVLDNPETKASIKDKLGKVSEFRQFAIDELLLPDNGSYLEYVPLERPAVVWSLFATPEFDLTPVQWCYPVTGCVSYRAYYDKEMAQYYAQKLTGQKLDVAMQAVPAYSTLGWFEDPVLSTMLQWDDWQLAAFLFHEMAHQKLYIADDVVFNESFATAVEQIGVEAYLSAVSTEKLAEYRRQLQYREAFHQVVREGIGRLEQIYSMNMTKPEMMAEKERVFAVMKKSYRAWAKNWSNQDPYGYWFDQELNNAHLIAVAVYHQWLAAFKFIYHEVSGDTKKFYERVLQLAEKSRVERNIYLSQLTEKLQ